jgi:hypothetical protein
LHVAGGKIVDSSGTPVVLRGINFETWLYKLNGETDPNENANGWFVREGHMWYWGTDFGTSWNTSTAEGNATEAAVRMHFSEMRSWGMNVVRMHFCIEPWFNDNSRAPIDQYRYHLKRCAEIAEEEGLYVIYDVWSYHQHLQSPACYPFYPYESYCPPTFDENGFANWWGEFANYFKDTPNVIFEVYNEPHHDEAYTSVAKLTEWQRIHNKTIAAIRQHSQNLVIAQYFWGLDGYDPTPYGVSWVYDYPLAGGNIVYSVHAYRYHDHFGFDRPYDRETLVALLTQMKVIGADSPMNNGTAPLIVGETGAYQPDSNPSELAFLANFLDILNSEGVHYLAFEWGWPGRGFSMTQNQPMMAPPNTAGQVLKDALGS